MTSQTTRTHRVTRDKKEEVEPLRDRALLLVHPFPFAIAVPGEGVPLGRSLLVENSELMACGAQACGEQAWAEYLGKISRRQAFFSLDEGGSLWVKDAGSKNGGWLNGNQAIEAGSRCKVAPDSVLRFGDLVFIYHPGLVRALLGKGQEPLGEMVAPWGLWAQREELEILASKVPRNVLLLGPSGTGKELFAREMASRFRDEKPCCFWNIAAGPESIFEAQLFGHEKGAFTGANERSLGVIRSAEGGVVVLDEIGELPLSTQAKLLRFLESGEVQPIGANRPVKVDVLCILSTHRDLSALVREGKFREDLFARIEFPSLTLPTLQERRGDVVAIANRLLENLHAKGRVSADVAEFLSLCSWPRNIRQLRSVLAQSLDKTGNLSLERLRQASRGVSETRATEKPTPDTTPALEPSPKLTRPTTVKEYEDGLEMFESKKAYAIALGWTSSSGLDCHLRKLGLYKQISPMSPGRKKSR